MRKIIIGLAAFAASIAVVSFPSATPAQAGQQIACSVHAVQNGRCYYNSRRAIGYRTVTVRRPVYAVRRACQTVGCAPVSAPCQTEVAPAPITHVPCGTCDGRSADSVSMELSYRKTACARLGGQMRVGDANAYWCVKDGYRIRPNGDIVAKVQ